MEAKFTPGPWRVRFGNIGHVKAENGALVAKCQRLTSLCNLQANAHLIAAAPEIYGCLRDVLETFQTLNPEENPNEYTKLIGNIISTLAKARGETPET